MNFEVGSTVEGKITGVKPFGAFVALNEEKQGLVHISEISHEYVKDINDYVKVGDTVEVKITGIDETNGKISLSIRQTKPAPERKPAAAAPNRRPANNRQPKQEEKGFNTLESKLKDWLKESNDRQAQLNKRLKK
jgi:general stress protein 13